MEYYQLIKTHKIFGNRGRLISYSMYSNLSDDHKKLFKQMKDERYGDLQTINVKIKQKDFRRVPFPSFSPHD